MIKADNETSLETLFSTTSSIYAHGCSWISYSFFFGSSCEIFEILLLLAVLIIVMTIM